MTADLNKLAVRSHARNSQKSFPKHALTAQHRRHLERLLEERLYWFDNG
jgi:hypothetical protein